MRIVALAAATMFLVGSAVAQTTAPGKSGTAPGQTGKTPGQQQQKNPGTTGKDFAPGQDQTKSGAKDINPGSNQRKQ